jgi:fatty acid desaturase
MCRLVPRECCSASYTSGMGQLASDAARKLLAVAVLIVAAYVLFKLVLGFVAAIAWIVVAVVAVFAVIWAVRVL